MMKKEENDKNDAIMEDLRDKKSKWKNVDKSILEYAYSKKELTYLENKALYCLGVLEDEHSMNGNIAGKFYKDEFSTPV